MKRGSGAFSVRASMIASAAMATSAAAQDQPARPSSPRNPRRRILPTPIVQPQPARTTPSTSPRGAARSLQDVPAAITAFTDDTIEAAASSGRIDFVNLTSNVDPGRDPERRQRLHRHRGITQARNSEPSVAVIVDGVAAGEPGPVRPGAVRHRADRGAQGSARWPLRRNAIGGAIVIRTRQPTDEFEGMVRAGVDNGFGYWPRGTVSGPVSDTLRFRLPARGTTPRASSTSVPRRGGRSGRGSRPARHLAVGAEQQFHGRPARLD